MLRDNVYGWFERVGRGVYDVAPGGRNALEQYADVVALRTETVASHLHVSCPAEDGRPV